MKKIILMIVAIMLTFGLFAQDKIVIDEEAAKELDKLKTALEAAGIDFDDCSFIPEEDGKDIEDYMSVDEFVENLKSGEKDSRSTYISGYALYPQMQWYWTGGGFVLLWNGNVSSSPDISGDDWDGVKHWREAALGTQYDWSYVSNPDYAYMFYDIPGNTYKICAQLFNYERVYVPGVGYMIIPQPFGDEECGIVNWNW